MATQVYSDSKLTSAEHRFSLMEKYVIHFFHPRSLMVDVVGFMWATYYLWMNDWKSALGAFILARVFASISVLNIKTHEFAETVLAKIALLHLNPYNLIIQSTGLIVYIYGVWWHSVEILLLGISVIFLGHLLGWERVDPRFADKNS